jgi:hypothetical protein
LNTFFDENPQKTSLRIMGVVFLTAVVVRLLNIAFIGDVNIYAFVEDSSIYWNGAQYWLDSGFFARKAAAGFVPETERMPLYHLFLTPFRWGFPDTGLPVLIAQMIMDSTTCVLIALVGGKLGVRVGLVSGLLAAAWPNLIIHSQLILGDSLFVFLLTASLYLLVRFVEMPSTALAVSVGLCLGLAIATRPIALFLPLGAACIATWKFPNNCEKFRRRIAMAITILVMASLPISPIVLRNISNFGTWQLTSQTGTHFLVWVVSYARSLDQGVPFSEGSLILQHKLNDRMLEARQDGLVVTDFTASDIAMKLAKEELATLATASVVKAWVSGMVINLGTPAIVTDPRIRKLNNGSFMNSTGSGAYERLLTFIGNNENLYITWIVAGMVGGAIALIFQAVGSILLFRNMLFPFAICILWIFYFLILSGPVSAPKYRLPIEPVLIIFQALAISKLIARRKSQR